MEHTVAWRKGPRINLRPVQESDLPFFNQTINDPRNNQFLVVDHPLGIEAQREWGKKVMAGDRNQMTLAITFPDGKPIGNIALRIYPEQQNAETGTLLGFEQQRKGYATEAKMLLLDYAFNQRAMRHVISKILRHNEKSLDYGRRCGYKPVATIPEQHFRNGQWIDEYIYMVKAGEWEPHWQKWVTEQMLIFPEWSPIPEPTWLKT